NVRRADPWIMFGLIPVDEQSRSLGVMNETILHRGVLHKALNDNAGSGPVVRILAGVVNDASSHGEIFTSTILINITRIKTDGVSRCVVDNAINDFDVLRVAASPTEVTYDDAILVLTQ